MATEIHRSPAEVVKSHSAATHDAFMTLRKTVNEAGPLPAHIRELIVASNFATLNIEHGFLTHGGRALEYGATVDELRHAVLVTLGANAVFPHVAQALAWIDELVAKRVGS